MAGTAAATINAAVALLRAPSLTAKVPKREDLRFPRRVRFALLPRRPVIRLKEPPQPHDFGVVFGGKRAERRHLLQLFWRPRLLLVPLRPSWNPTNRDDLSGAPEALKRLLDPDAAGVAIRADIEGLVLDWRGERSAALETRRDEFESEVLAAALAVDDGLLADRFGDEDVVAECVVRFGVAAHGGVLAVVSGRGGLLDG
jgi:hypothetical protein